MEYIAIDLETTGLSTKTDRIIEVGGVHMRDGQEIGVLSLLINPKMRIPERITELTGITEAMVQEEKPIGERIGEILTFCQELPLVGHHIITDYSFLKKAAVAAGMIFEREGIDTLALTRKLYPNLEKKNLGFVCQTMGYQTTGRNFHRALEDARACAWLLEQMLGQNEQIICEMQKKLVYNVKKEKSMTLHQKEDLIHLIKYHKIETHIDIDSLTRNEASRLIDSILSRYGRCPKERTGRN